MSAAIKLPEPEVKEINWNDLSGAEKYRFTRFDNWPHIVVQVVEIPTLEDRINEDHQ